MSAPDRFWSKVDVRGQEACWPWKGRRDADGYGRVQHAGRDQQAHRVSWELSCGPIPAGLCVLHKCDVPPCVNPDHLWLGTNAENLADMRVKGRAASGSRNGRAKLTEADVRAIRVSLATGCAQRAIATGYGVSRGLIGMIASRDRWRHIS